MRSDCEVEDGDLLTVLEGDGRLVYLVKEGEDL